MHDQRNERNQQNRISTPAPAIYKFRSTEIHRVGVGAHSLSLLRLAGCMVLVAGRGGGMTLKAIAEGLLGAFFRECENPEELKMREEAALVAVTRLYERRMAEIRTHDQMRDLMSELLKGEDSE